MTSISLHHRSNINAAAPFHPASNAVVFVLGGYSKQDFAGSNLPHISAMESTGVTYGQAWSGEFPTVPSTLAASLSTGALPRRHGLLGNEWVDPRTHQAIAPLSNPQTLTGSIDQVLEPSGTSSVASVLKGQRPTATILSVGGSNCATASAAASWAADYVLCAARSHDHWRPVAVAGHSLPAGTFGAHGDEVAAAHGPGLGPRVEGWKLGAQDDWVTDTAITAMNRVHPALTYVTFPEPDALGEYAARGDRNRVMNTLLRGIDRDIGRVVAETHHLKKYGDTVFVLVSTHGFEPTTVKIPTSKFRRAVVGTGTLPAYLWGDGTAMLGIVDASLAQAVAGVIASERIQSLDAIYYESHHTYQAQYINPDLPVAVAEAQSYLLGTTDSRASAQVIGALPPHVGLQGGRLAGLPRTAAGVGMQWSNQRGFLVISGHGTFRNERSDFPARLVDIAPTLESLLGLPVVRGDGDILADATFRPPAGATRIQQRVKGRWSRYLDALQSWENRAG